MKTGMSVRVWPVLVTKVAFQDQKLTKNKPKPILLPNPENPIWCLFIVLRHNPQWLLLTIDDGNWYASTCFGLSLGVKWSYTSENWSKISKK